MIRQILKTTKDVESWFKDATILAIDTETTDLNYYRLDLVGISCCDGQRSCYIDLFENPQFEDMIARLQVDIQNLDRAICHSLPFDMNVLYKYGIILPENSYCTCTGQHLLDENGTKSLKRLAGYYQFPDCEYIEEFEQASRFGFQTERFYNYAIRDAEWAWLLAQKQIPELYKQELWDLWYNIERPFQKCVSEMERNGVLIDTKKLVELKVQLQTIIKNLQIELCKIGDIEFVLQSRFDDDQEVLADINFDSPEQIGCFIESKLKIHIPEKTKEGKPSTAAEVLKKLRHPFIKKLLEYRSAQALMSKFIEKIPKHIDKDGRVRASFNNTGTVTGRLSSSNPNLQNPPRSETGPVDVRQCLIASPGKKLIDIDFSRQELRVLAQISQDPTMLQIFKDNRDLHQEVANKLNITRQDAKPVNFGVVYGQTSEGLASSLNIEEKKAQEFIDSYFKMFPKVKEAIDKTIVELKAQHYITNLAGRRRRIDVINSYGIRQAFNFKIQGSSADQMKAAAVAIDNNKIDKWNLKLLMSIHDELVYEIDEQYAEEALKFLCKLAEDAFPLESVVNVVEGGIGKTYSEAKK